jgi:hypothetical protein
MLPLRRFATAAALAALGAAPSSSLIAQESVALDPSRTGDPVPLLLRRDAPLPSSDPVPPFDPTDPSTALAFDFTQNGVNFNGIGQLITPIGGGFASFCTTQRIGPNVVLTAAHCVTNDATGALLPGAQPGGGAFVRFLGPGSTTSARAFQNFEVASVTVRNDWVGFNVADLLWKDIAVVKFATVLPDWVTTYPLFLGDASGLPSTHVGYGTYGTGSGATNFDSRRRWGTNDVEWIPDFGGFFGDLMPIVDFDNGTAQFDVFCLALGVCNQGLLTEAGIAAGDSGGGLFVNGALVGVASFGSFFCTPGLPGCVPYVSDPTRPFDSFGAFMGFAPVDLNEQFIRSASAPEPSTVVLMGGGLMILLGAAARRRRQ